MDEDERSREWFHSGPRFGPEAADPRSRSPPPGASLVKWRGSPQGDIGRDMPVGRLALPLAIQNWSLTSVQQRLFKTGGRLIRHARYFTLQLAESYLTRPLFRQIVARIQQLAWHPT